MRNEMYPKLMCEFGVVIVYGNPMPCALSKQQAVVFKAIADAGDDFISVNDITMQLVMDTVGDSDREFEDGHIRQVLHKIKRKLAHTCVTLENRWGYGYRFVVDESEFS